jgi:hypothetical protein
MSRFKEFYAVYPKKIGAKKAEKVWDRDNLDEKADQIIGHVQGRKRLDPQWQTKQFIPGPEAFLNQARWEDEYETRDERTKTTSILEPDPYIEKILKLQDTDQAWAAARELKNYPDVDARCTIQIERERFRRLTPEQQHNVYVKLGFRKATQETGGPRLQTIDTGGGDPERIGDIITGHVGVPERDA